MTGILHSLAASYAAVVRALMIGNVNGIDAGFVGHRLRQRGYAFTECMREEPDALARTSTASSSSSRSGRSGTCTGRRRRRSSRPRRRSSARPSPASVPLLAICFGAQVLSHALGGAVTRSADAGDRLVRLPDHRSARRHRPVDGVARRRVHGAGGVRRAGHADAGPQLIRGGRCVGTQFHPEATETMIARLAGRAAAPSSTAATAATRMPCSPRPGPTSSVSRPARRRRSSTGSSTTSPAADGASPWISRPHLAVTLRQNGARPWAPLWEGIHEPW